MHFIFLLLESSQPGLLGSDRYDFLIYDGFNLIFALDLQFHLFILVLSSFLYLDFFLNCFSFEGGAALLIN